MWVRQLFDDGAYPAPESWKAVVDAHTSIAAFLLHNAKGGVKNMGFKIEVKTGESGPVILRGCSDGTVEFCKWGETTDLKTKEKKPALIAYKFYANIAQAFDRIARMRIASVQANDLKELVTAIKTIREDIKREMGALN